MLQAGLEGAARGLELISLRQAIDQLELRFARLAVEFDRSECWDYECANSAIDWIRINCKMTSNAISDRIAVGEHSSDLAESTQAMDAGEIGFAHLAVMARAATAARGGAGCRCSRPRSEDPDAGDQLGRDPAQPDRRAGRGDGILAAGLLEDGGALGLRQQHHADPPAGLGRDRRRSGEASHLGTGAPGSQLPRPALPVAWMRAARVLV